MGLKKWGLKKLILNYYTSHLNWTHWGEESEVAFWLKKYITIDVILLKIFIFMIFFTTICYFTINSQFSYHARKRLYYFSIEVDAIALILVSLQLYWLIQQEKGIFSSTHTYELDFLKTNQNLGIVESTLTFPNYYGVSILFISILIGINYVSWYKLVDLFESISNFTLFSIINLLILIIITTNNLLIIFLIFETILILTVLCTNSKSLTYNTESIKKMDEILKYKLYRALIGSIGILMALLYIYIKCGTLNCYYISEFEFTLYEAIIWVVIILFWFYTKVSIFTFYYGWVIEKKEFFYFPNYPLFLIGILILLQLVAMYFIFMFAQALIKGLIWLWVIGPVVT